MGIEMQRLRIKRHKTEHRVVHLGDGTAEFVVKLVADGEFFEIEAWHGGSFTDR
jgi:hypothetical protein